jgi:formate hydrogenlyase subunit 4
VKAWFAGRQGPPTLQLYHDLFRLLGKGAVYSRTSTWVLRLAPSLGLAGCLLATLLVPAEPFPGAWLLLLGLLALQRFALVLAALDTGSSFEGMGASREVQFGALAELGLLLCLAVAVRQGGEVELPVQLLLAGALLLLFLAENARVPVDDPNTHLELTMIHEVMILDLSGPDLAFVLYASALKMWVLGLWMLGLVFPGAALATLVAALAGLALLVGVVESTTARLRLTRVPQMLLGASALAGLALLLLTRVP